MSRNYPERRAQPATYPPDRPRTLEAIVEHMRADALAYMAERGPDDCVGQWLWNLADKLAADAAELHPPSGRPRIPQQRRK